MGLISFFGLDLDRQVIIQVVCKNGTIMFWWDEESVPMSHAKEGIVCLIWNNERVVRWH